MKFNLNIENIKYIKVLYKDNNGEPSSLKGAIRRVTEREMLICAKFEEGLFAPTPQEITLSIICNDGLYRTKTKLRSIDNEDPYAFLVLDPPQGLEYQQNREYFRVLADYRCDYLPDGVNRIKASTFDISANGVSIIVDTHLISKTDSELDIAIDGRNIKTKVRYVRSEKVDEGYKISFMFSNISENDRNYISQICIKKQLEQRRKGLI